jgi:ribonuclease HI
LITDLRRLNDYGFPPKFVNEGINDVIELIQPGDKLVTLDIKNGFFHIPVHSSHQKFLGFEWQGKFFQWKCLPFGLNSSPYFFYKTIRPVVEYLRQQGLRVVAFVDDFLLMSHYDHIDDDSKVLVDTLTNLGLCINFAKSLLTPDTAKEYIGYVLKTINPDGRVWVHIPSSRVRKVRRDIKRVLSRGFATARSIARIAGQCVSMCKVIIPCKLLLRNLYRLLKLRASWQDLLKLDTGSIRDLEWWLEALGNWNGRAIVHKTIDIQITTDASSWGWGTHMNGLKAQGFWNDRMSYEHSNYRELMAVMMALQSFKDQLKGHNVQLLCDNITTIAYLNNLGGSEKKLSELATAIWSECYRLNIQLQAKHLAGKDNCLADQLSRMSMKYDWMLHPAVFNYIETIYGPHDIDRFASMLTTQLPVYNSLAYDPGTSGVDALAQKDWGPLNNFVNPPFFLIPNILNVVEEQRAVATLIAPIWPAQTWYQRLTRMAIAPPIVLPMTQRLMWALNHRAEPLRNKAWKIGIWRISGR